MAWLGLDCLCDFVFDCVRDGRPRPRLKLRLGLFTLFGIGFGFTLTVLFVCIGCHFTNFPSLIIVISCMQLTFTCKCTLIIVDGFCSCRLLSLMARQLQIVNYFDGNFRAFANFVFAIFGFGDFGWQQICCLRMFMTEGNPLEFQIDFFLATIQTAAPKLAAGNRPMMVKLFLALALSLSLSICYLLFKR